MLKTQYLDNDHVKSFVTWFAAALKNTAIEHFYDTPGPTRVVFKGLPDALRQYDWPFSFVAPASLRTVRGRTFADSTRALTDLQKGIGAALNSKNDADVRDWSIAVMQWGGVINGNVKWLKAKTTGLSQHISATSVCLKKGDDDKTKLKAQVTRFNAGMTKVYSLLVPDLPIYDSRVAAALSWFVVKWCQSANRPTVPLLLRFPCMRPKEAESAKLRKCRNASCTDYVFPWLVGAANHAHWNLRAGWVLRAALDQAKGTAFDKEANPLRALEAALFMWGYDLSLNPACKGRTNQVLGVDDQAELPELAVSGGGPDQRWRNSRTQGGKAKAFKWHLDAPRDAILLNRGRGTEVFAIGDLFRVVHELFDRFGYDWFPLANNVQSLSAGTEIPGIGRVLFDVYNGPKSGRVAYAQAASQLGVIMESLRLLEGNRAKRGIAWRIAVEPPDTIEELRMMMRRN